MAESEVPKGVGRAAVGGGGGYVPGGVRLFG